MGGRERQEDLDFCGFKASLVYIIKPCLKKKKRKREGRKEERKRKHIQRELTHTY